MQTTRQFRCAFSVINALVGAPLAAPVAAMGQFPPTPVALTTAHDSSPFAGGIPGRAARLTPPAALLADTSRSSDHLARNAMFCRRRAE